MFIVRGSHLLRAPKFQSAGALLFWSLMGLLPWQKGEVVLKEDPWCFDWTFCNSDARSVLSYLWIKHAAPLSLFLSQLVLVKEVNAEHQHWHLNDGDLLFSLLIRCWLAGTYGWMKKTERCWMLSKVLSCQPWSTNTSPLGVSKHSIHSGTGKLKNHVERNPPPPSHIRTGSILVAWFPDCRTTSCSSNWVVYQESNTGSSSCL